MPRANSWHVFMPEFEFVSLHLIDQGGKRIFLPDHIFSTLLNSFLGWAFFSSPPETTEIIMMYAN